MTIQLCVYQRSAAGFAPIGHGQTDRKDLPTTLFLLTLRPEQIPAPTLDAIGSPSARCVVAITDEHRITLYANNVDLNDLQQTVSKSLAFYQISVLPLFMHFATIAIAALSPQSQDDLAILNPHPTETSRCFRVGAAYDELCATMQQSPLPALQRHNAMNFPLLPSRRASVDYVVGR